MRLLSNNEFIINNVNDNNNVIILLYKMFIKRVSEIIKRKQRNYDIYNDLKFIL